MNLKFLAPFAAAGFGAMLFSTPAAALDHHVKGKVIHTEQVVTQDGFVKELTFKDGKVVDTRVVGRVDHRFQNRGFYNRSLYGKHRYHPRSRFVKRPYGKRYYGGARHLRRY